MPRPARRPARGLARISLLAPTLALPLVACGVTRVPPGVPRPAEPLPLVLGVCAAPDGVPAEPFGPDGALFARVVDARAPGARPDVVAHLRTTPATREARRATVGFFLWTVGVVPMVFDVAQTTTATFHAPAPGDDPCATGGDAGGLAIAAAGEQAEVVGWVAWLLQPTPWWSASDRVAGEPKLARRERIALVRGVLARRAEILALARR